MKRTEKKERTDTTNGWSKFREALAEKIEYNSRNQAEIIKDEEDLKKAIDLFFESSFFEIDNKILNQIKKLRYDQFILLIGKKVTLAKYVATVINFMYEEMYGVTTHTFSLEDEKYFKEKTKFEEQSYVGWGEKEIEEHLFLLENPLINFLLEGNTLFLRGIENQRIFKRLYDIARDYRENYGVLIIHAIDEEFVPEEILEKFEKIYLEPNRIIRDVLKALPLQGQAEQVQDEPKLNTPECTKWLDIELRVVDCHTLNVKIKDNANKRIDYRDMGMEDKRNKKPNRSWEMLIGLIQGNGVLNNFRHVHKIRIEKRISLLRKDLQEYFQIYDDPILYTDKEGYKCVFRIRSEYTENYRKIEKTNNISDYDPEDLN